jgi:hypothetical protein
MKLMTGRAELLGNFHAPQRLAVAFGMGHAEVAADTVFCAAALAIRDDQHFVHRPSRAMPHATASSSP